MTPARFNECLEWLHWDTDVLAGVLDCDQGLTEANGLGLAEVPMKLGAWLEVLAHAHEGAESGRPAELKGNRYMGLMQ